MIYAHQVPSEKGSGFRGKNSFDRVTPLEVYPLPLRGLDSFSRFAAIFHKGEFL